MSDEDVPRDWRGTEIKVGSPIVYGGPVGRSIQLVEGEVVGFSKTGRVNVKIIRRAYTKAWGHSDKRVVHVGQDRLIVLNPDSLPPTTLPTWDEAIQAAVDERDSWDRNEASHDLPPVVIQTPDPSRPWDRRYTYPPCRRCGANPYEARRKACVGG